MSRIRISSREFSGLQKNSWEDWVRPIMLDSYFSHNLGANDSFYRVTSSIVLVIYKAHQLFI